jgi:spore germination protein
MSKKISASLDENIKLIETTYEDCGDFVSKKFHLGKTTLFSGTPVYMFYFDMLINREIIELQVVNRLQKRLRENPLTIENLRESLFDPVTDGGVSTIDINEETDIDEIFKFAMMGNTVMLVDGIATAFLVSAIAFPNRGVPTADTEVVLQGAKDAFSEVFRINTMLLRRRIRDTQLKIKQSFVGKRSQTTIAIAYLDDVVRPEILKEVEDKIKDIDIDAILDSGYIEQLIETNTYSPFPQMQMTERPDKAAAAIFEGRIVVLVDNSPFALIVPATFNTFMQAAEDYYQRFSIMAFTRVLRFIALFIAIALPGLYLSVAVYSPSMLPLPMILKIAEARKNVPFPAIFEILLMEFSFEMLREAGVRLPAPVGNTIGIVGGLIIGQSAVEAGLVSPIVVIVVAMTAIAGFAIPHASLVTGVRLVKYIVTILAGCFGLVGFWMGMLFIVSHLAGIRSFGIPYLTPMAASDIYSNHDSQDSVIRSPLPKMNKRPSFARKEQRTRQKGK